VADQGPRKGVGGATRQGIYCLSASGRLLAFRNHQDPDAVRELLDQGLQAWTRLPESERRPGAVRVPDAPAVDRNYSRTPPEGGLVLDVSTRILERNGKGRLVRGSCEFTGGDRAARDHAWLTRADWQALIPADPHAGDHFAMPHNLALRLARYHLVDNTRGEPPFWENKDVHKLRITWTVEEVTAETIRLRLDGHVVLADGPDPARAVRGFDAAVAGRLRYDRVNQKVYRLELAAVGDHWGRGEYTPGERPGRQPLGVAMELSRGDRPADRVPPQAARDLGDYLRPGP
jgi:hypothetical protein